ncbi:MAG: hypothetical protein VKJ24_01095, partial [Synechococcales bacterium]|nr:hypothetical protein [Synechococcales bacterium]
QVQLCQDSSLLRHWEQQAMRVWDTHPTAQERWATVTSDPYYRMGMHRRFAAFSGPFDRFVYMDADTLLLSDITPIFDQLATHDWVVYDFQHYDPAHVYDCGSAKLLEVFSPTQIDREIFCAGFYAAKRGIFNQEQLDALLAYLQAGEAEILYCMAPDQTILNYWVMRSQLSVYNFALQLPQEKATGCCVTSCHFEQQDDRLFDRGNPLTYLHYIGLSSRLFQRLCEGENLDFPYRDLFLHYRYLRDPHRKPQYIGKPRPYNQRTLTERLLTKFGLPR